MISRRWIEKRQPHWRRLEELSARAGQGLAAFQGEELQELGLLYRQTASDLSTVRHDRSSPQLSAYLNGLLARGHHFLYIGHRERAAGPLRFYTETFPRAFRETLPLTLLATAIFLVAGIFGWALTARNIQFAHLFLGPQMMESIEQRKMWTESIVAVKPLASSAITTNNLSVAFMTFALGITGLGTLWLLLLNGLMMGVVGAATFQAGMAQALWSFVSPHGALELPAILIAGGGGLELARGLFFPGYLPRKVSLVQAAGRAVKLVAGVIPLLLIAGAIEGFYSPTKSPAGLKFAVGAALFAALLAYLTQAGRGAVGPVTEDPDL